MIAKAALFNENNEVLVLTRSMNDETRPGRFDFPGGGIEEDDISIAKGMLREIEEEIGILLTEQEIELGYTATSYYDDTSSIRFLFVGKIQKDSTIELSEEHSSWEWMDPERFTEKYDHPVWVGGLRYLIDNKQL